MVGSSNWSFARPTLHCFTNAVNMLVVCWWCLPFILTALRYLSLAALHLSSNQGAICLSHLLGLRAICLVLTLSTSAFSASSNRNASIFADLSSLSCA
jgi:hypothetical protein